MSKKEKGEFGYLKYKRSFNLLLTIIAFLIIAAVFVTGLIIFKSRNNYMTLVYKQQIPIYTCGISLNSPFADV